jgi:shikimate kinase
MDAETRAAIRAKATSIWLRADLDLMVKRVSRRNDRPLLKGVDPREKLAALIEQRYPVYAEADLVVDSIDAPPEETVAAVRRALEAHLRSVDPAAERKAS